MKTIKPLALYSLVIILCATAFEGCKKGPEDPAFSLRSRKARLVGDWEIITYTVEGENYLMETETLQQHDYYCGNYTLVNEHERNITIEIEKDGDFVITTETKTDQTRDYTPGSGCGDATSTFENTAEVKGDWDFGAGIGDYKSKEQLILNVKRGAPIVIDIVKLSSNEMKWSGMVDGEYMEATLEPD